MSLWLEMLHFFLLGCPNHGEACSANVLAEGWKRRWKEREKARERRKQKLKGKWVRGVKKRGELRKQRGEQRRAEDGRGKGRGGELGGAELREREERTIVNTYWSFSMYQPF